MKINQIIPIWEKEKKHYVKRSTMSAYYLLCHNHILPFFGEMEEVR